ncbi:DUF1127 domain-containing protein [Devosia rhodophyticola]|uniref:DUF1127 domain-containing protein n=1 Tax=Devosia rhodophyticola TaxID=3026423 RepID=A0ABY7YY78_9HYPH|nr:DUF1127 domain-containing protein [Devosia rhodophyticola]WDR06117.1 DUF1127 domain-containing protein [Devosia rhodophyticola]
MTIAKKIASYVAQRRAIRELSAMDKHQLNDLGITRADIPKAVRGF